MVPEGASDPQPAPTASPSAELDAKVAEATLQVEIQEKVVDALRTCFDPEIPVNIYELGLIYDINVSPALAQTVIPFLDSE